ncbi:hypothetical protein DV738_g3176, partial [Chaetothyriales sp. CBS 135597]
MASSAGIVHIVLFSFKSAVNAAAVDTVCTQMIALKDKCLHPTSGKPYIKSLTGGLDNSPEGVQGGITHAFVVEFHGREDRDYYVNDDPAHAAFKELAGKAVDKVQVIDYAPGVFFHREEAKGNSKF